MFMTRKEVIGAREMLEDLHYKGNISYDKITSDLAEITKLLGDTLSRPTIDVTTTSVSLKGFLIEYQSIWR